MRIPYGHNMVRQIPGLVNHHSNDTFWTMFLMYFGNMLRRPQQGALWQTVAKRTGDYSILIACSASELDAETASAAGIADVLQKPITKEGLRHVLHKWLPRPRDLG